MMQDLSEIQISYHPIIQPGMLPKITVSFQAFELFLQSWDMGKINYVEQLKVMLLNQDNRVLGIYEASSGGICSTVLDPKPIFVAALMACATTIILAHNHPSGDNEPSPEDILLTRQIIKAGKLLDIKVLDHMIITSDFFVSLRDRRIIRT